MNVTSTVLITDKQCTCLNHTKLKTKLQTEWTLAVSDIQNITVEEDQLIVHLTNGGDPIITKTDNMEKLKSIQLALEYAVLLAMPYTCSTLARN